MNILVTGANGQLGREMRTISVHTTDHYVFTDVVMSEDTDTVLLDMTDAEAVNRIVDAENICSIVNCAAYTNVDKAESDEALCRKLNTEAPRILAETMKRVDGLLVHISTDYVFGGELYNVPCREDQIVAPTGVYGRTKHEGEQAILSTGCNHIILRTAWLYSEYGRNFVKTMLNLTATRPQLKVVFDQVGSPTYAFDLANAISIILAKEKELMEKSEKMLSGIFHYSNEGVCSWYDFAKAIALMAGYTACDIQPCHSSEYPSPVHRPAYSVLDKTKVKETFGVDIPYWVDSLRKCINNIRKI